MGSELRIAIGLEGWFSTLQPIFAHQGIMLTRENFAKMAVYPIVSPRAALELAQNGLELVGIQPVATPPPNRGQVRDPRRNPPFMRN